MLSAGLSKKNKIFDALVKVSMALHNVEMHPWTRCLKNGHVVAHLLMTFQIMNNLYRKKIELFQILHLTCVISGTSWLCKLNK